MIDTSLSHTKWNCTYHIVFIPKYRRKVMYGEVRKEIGEILRKLCTYKGVEILDGSVCIDHIHLCVKIPPKFSVSEFMGYLKGKSALMIFDKHPEYKQKGNRHFWAQGYFVDTVGRNEQDIRKYIKQQVDADMIEDGIKKT
ncbi:MAG: IS200/IS605 family transposase [Ruminococcaceae bacterium]|nr:IS200/IS605 family transposase [Oscillospiraceae bacterium]